MTLFRNTLILILILAQALPMASKRIVTSHHISSHFEAGAGETQIIGEQHQNLSTLALGCGRSNPFQCFEYNDYDTPSNYKAAGYDGCGSPEKCNSTRTFSGLVGLKLSVSDDTTPQKLIMQRLKSGVQSGASTTWPEFVKYMDSLNAPQNDDSPGVNIQFDEVTKDDQLLITLIRKLECGCGDARDGCYRLEETWRMDWFVIEDKTPQANKVKMV